MKRFVGVAMLCLLAVGAVAQGTFTIRRPLDGSTVRELVTVRFPKNSIPEGGYIGILINDKFVEAVMPQRSGDDFVYLLDSKARKLPDGPMKIEAVLYVDYSNKPQIVNRSSVNVKLDNYTSIRIPSEGLRLRYNFVPGTEWVYRFSANQTVSFISQAQAALGSRAGEVQTEPETFRMLYAVDNAYNVDGRKEGLLRMQALPNPGYNYAMLTTSFEDGRKRFYNHDMHPIFMRMSETGREIFSAAPRFTPFEGISTPGVETDLFALFPLPVLPSRTIKPGDVWQAATLMSNFDLQNYLNQQSYFHNVPARGQFEGVEWYRGVPCARIRTIISVGQRELSDMNQLNRIQGQAVRVDMEEKIWFAINRGNVMKVEANLTQESLITVGGPAAQQGGRPAQPQGTGGGGRSGGGQRGGQLAALHVPDINDIKPADFEFAPQVDPNGALWLFQQRGGRMGVGGPEGAGTPAANPQRTSGAAAAPQRQVMRVRLQYVMELDR